MEGVQLKSSLASLRWSQRALAEVLECDDRLVRRWIAGSATVPPDVAEWLTDLAALHSDLPPPVAWRRRADPQHQGTRKGNGLMSDVQSIEPSDASPKGGKRGREEASFELQNIAWDWQPGGTVVARGRLSVTPGGEEAGPVILNFELPVKAMPGSPALKNPQSWVLTSLRRALRR